MPAANFALPPGLQQALMQAQLAHQWEGSQGGPQQALPPPPLQGMQEALRQQAHQQALLAVHSQAAMPAPGHNGACPDTCRYPHRVRLKYSGLS